MNVERCLRLSLVVITWSIALAAPLRAQSLIERLISPGDVANAHVKAEKQCGACHESFSKQGQDQLCVECHKDVGADIRDRRGFHGRAASARDTVCKHCHTDHKGRSFDMVQFDRETFDHSSADFELNGRHKAVPCGGCHGAGKKFRDAPGACADCHKKDDAHNGRLGSECGNCHNERVWKEAKTFDHGKTKFPLTGAHAEVGCNACHAGERYKGVPVACAECHRQQDKHKGLYGEKCDNCHTALRWAEIKFDHNKDTKYPLVAKHLTTACGSCHKGDPYTVKTPKICSGCHNKDDVHKGRLGSSCQECHNISGWRIGALFDHSKTKLPLTGAHASAKCSDCHTGKISDPVLPACSSCHAKKDIHAGRLGPKCEQCHNDADWSEWHFDHAKQSRFPLKGAHAKIGCYACHDKKSVERATLPVACNSCHGKDDVHKGAFGSDCGNCHTQDKFLPAFLRR